MSGLKEKYILLNLTGQVSQSYHKVTNLEANEQKMRVSS